MNIVFEGIDASGKTTLINALKDYLNGHNVNNQVIADIKEPTPLLPVFQKMFSSNFLELDENFKTSLYQTLLFACSHFYVQEKNKDNKHITIYDRDIFTLLSYQKELIRQDYPDDYNDFFDSFRKMLGFHSKKIDILVYVSIPLEENIKRKIKRDGLVFSDKERETLCTFKKNMESEIAAYLEKHPETILLKLDGRESPANNCRLILQEIKKITQKQADEDNDKDDKIFQ